MSFPIGIAIAALALIGCDLALAALGISRYPALFSQQGAWEFVAELSGVLAIYVGAAARLFTLRGQMWREVCRFGCLFGCVTGGLEVLNIGMETWLPKSAGSGALRIAFMAAVFLLWGAAAARAVRTTGSVRAGVFAAVLSAGLCMLVAVAAGFAVELFLATPDVNAIQTWPEFERSGWTDARAFGLANTLDSGFTHLLIAPIVASLFGWAGSLIGQCKARHPQIEN